MNISFWNCSKEQSSLTKIVAAISMVMASKGRQHVCVCENHNKSSQKQYPGSIWDSYGLSSIKKCIGIEEVVELSNDVLLEDELKQCFLDLVPRHLSYLVHTKDKREDYMDYLFEKSVSEIFDYCNVKYDYSLYIVEHGDLSTKYILNQSDLNVILLPNNMRECKRILKEAVSILPKSVFICHYKKTDDAFLFRSFMKQYEIPKERISVIYKNEAYEEAIFLGNGLSFINHLSGCSGSNPNYLFYTQLSKTVKMIQYQAHQLPKKNGVMPYYPSEEYTESFQKQGNVTFG